MENGSDAKSQKLPLLALIASFVALLSEIATNLGKTFEAGQKHFYLTIGALWVATAVLAWSAKIGQAPKSTRIKWLILTASTLLVGILLGYRYYQYWELTYKKTDHAQPPKILIPQILPLPIALAAENPLHLDSFEINEDLSSFRSLPDHKFGAGPIVTSYQVDLNVYEAFKKGACIGVMGDRPAQAAVPVLRDFWSKNGRSDLSKYLEAPNSLGHLIRDRGDVFAQIIPTPQQLEGMQHTAPSDYEVVKAWFHDCVGLYNPVFTAVITNTTNQDVVITTVIYHVLEVGQVLGGFGGALYPLKTYDYTLEWRVGDQVQHLADPTPVIPAHGHASFNLRLSPASSKHGISWWMNVEIKDSAGHSVKTPMFDLTMNKEKP